MMMTIATEYSAMMSKTEQALQYLEQAASCPASTCCGRPVPRARSLRPEASFSGVRRSSPRASPSFGLELACSRCASFVKTGQGHGQGLNLLPRPRPVV